MSEWGRALTERFPDTYPCAISANSANSSELGANGAKDANGTEIETPNLLPGTCAECRELDDGLQSIVIELARSGTPWRHALCYSRRIKASGQI